jgi:adenylate kinase
MAMSKLLMFGPPGSGKGTQAARLAERRKMVHISTGEMLRAAMAAKTELGQRVKSLVDAGDLVPDALMLDLVENRLAEVDAQEGFLLDGFPRTVAQAEGLFEKLGDDGALDGVLRLSVPDDELVRRALARGRVDDSEETIRHRLDVYRRQTEPVLGCLEGRLPIFDIDGLGGLDDITELIEKELDAANS